VYAESAAKQVQIYFILIQKIKSNSFWFIFSGFQAIFRTAAFCSELNIGEKDSRIQGFQGARDYKRFDSVSCSASSPQGLQAGG